MELFGKYGWFEIDINKVNVAKCLEMVHTHFKSDSSCSKDIDFESFKSYIEQYRDVDEPKSKRQSAGMEINAILCSKAKKKIEEDPNLRKAHLAGEGLWNEDHHFSGYCFVSKGVAA